MHDAHAPTKPGTRSAPPEVPGSTGPGLAEPGRSSQRPTDADAGADADVEVACGWARGWEYGLIRSLVTLGFAPDDGFARSRRTVAGVRGLSVDFTDAAETGGCFAVGTDAGADAGEDDADAERTWARAASMSRRRRLMNCDRAGPVRAGITPS